LPVAHTWLDTALNGKALPSLLIVVGFGDGSLLRELEERAPSTRLLVLDPDARNSMALATNELVRQWRDGGRLAYFVAPDYAGAEEAWRIFRPADQPTVVVHPAVAQSTGLGQAKELLKKILFGVKANADARRRFAPRYLLNSLRNVPSIVDGHDVRALTDAYRGIPAIIAAAGPSLDRVIGELHTAQHRALFIACDTALRPLLHAGLTPQLVVGADPSTANARHFHSLPDCPDTWLIAESALDPSAAAPFADRTFWFRLANHHPWPWLNALGIDVGLVEMWGSVLTAAFQVACLAGCDPIVIVGADLSYSDGRPYARGTTYEFDWAQAVAGGSTLADAWQRQIARPDLVEIPDLRGVSTVTTPTLLSFRDWMLARIKASGRRVINATGAGMLFGEGVEQGTLEGSIVNPCDVAPVGVAIERQALRK
jgi:hypothetical protein